MAVFRFRASRHIHNCSDTCARLAVYAQHLHQFEIAGCDLPSVYGRNHPLAADFLHVRHAALVRSGASRLIGAQDARRDRVRRMALRQRGQLQHFGVVYILLALVVYCRHLEIALGDGSGLVHHDIFDVRQRLHEVGALNENSHAARAADPAKKRQRNTDHDRARTADDQECERSVDPVGPQLPARSLMKCQNIDHRPQNRQRQRAVADRRRIPSRKFGDELLGLGLALAGILYQLQDLGRRRLIEFLCGLDPKQTAHIHGSAYDLVARLHISGQALAGQRTCIER